MAYEGAFQCSKCPRSNDPEAPRSCPAWWETFAQDIETGKQRLEKSCAFIQLPTYLIEVARGTSRAAAETAKFTNVLKESMDQFVGDLNGRPHFLQSPTASPFQRQIGAIIPADSGDVFQQSISADQPGSKFSNDPERVGDSPPG
jgi:hypothetical protein